ncbi:hypothetical protein AB3S75_041310 [Citrus x aurantiifolia]
MIKNKRRGNVKLQSMLMPLSESDHLQKGNALELMLSLEKLNNEKLASLDLVINVPSTPCFSLLFLLVGG